MDLRILNIGKTSQNIIVSLDPYQGDQEIEIIDSAVIYLMALQANSKSVTFTDGEPFRQAKSIAYLAEALRSVGISVIVHTGYTQNELHAMSKRGKYTKLLIEQVDCLISQLREAL
ncbi:MAG TPA: 4Fe-4S cluster-binding domain-containing protein [Negativicutes bacterium]